MPNLRIGGKNRNVDDSLEVLKTELERFGEANDAATTDRTGRMLNITRDTGEFLAVLVRATAARRVLEIGTSNGYSGLPKLHWLRGSFKPLAAGCNGIRLSSARLLTFAAAGLAGDFNHDTYRRYSYTPVVDVEACFRSSCRHHIRPHRIPMSGNRTRALMSWGRSWSQPSINPLNTAKRIPVGIPQPRTP